MAKKKSKPCETKGCKGRISIHQYRHGLCAQCLEKKRGEEILTDALREMYGDDYYILNIARDTGAK